MKVALEIPKYILKIVTPFVTPPTTLSIPRSDPNYIQLKQTLIRNYITNNLILIITFANCN